MPRYEPPSIKFRGALARTMAAVQEQRKADEDVTGKVPCQWCTGKVSFTVFPSGASRGRCAGA
jgi:hypothetical protein